MDSFNSGIEPTQRDHQCKIMGTLMKFFKTRSVEDFAILMRPDNENSVLLNAVMQKGRIVKSVNIFDEEREVEIEDHNGGTTVTILPEGTLVIEYDKSEEDKQRSTIYVWVDDGGEVNYGTHTGE